MSFKTLAKMLGVAVVIGSILGFLAVFIEDKRIDYADANFDFSWNWKPTGNSDPTVGTVFKLSRDLVSSQDRTTAAIEAQTVAIEAQTAAMKIQADVLYQILYGRTPQ